MTESQIDEWIRANFRGGFKRFRVYNDKNNYKFGEIGNFNIWFYGNATTEGTGIAINHWSGQVYAIKIEYPNAEIIINRLINSSELYNYVDSKLSNISISSSTISNWAYSTQSKVSSFSSRAVKTGSIITFSVLFQVNSAISSGTLFKVGSINSSANKPKAGIALSISLTTGSSAPLGAYLAGSGEIMVIGPLIANAYYQISGTYSII